MTIHLLAKSLMKNRHYSIHYTKLLMAFLSIVGCFLRMKEILIISLNQKYFLLSIKTFYIVRLPLIQQFNSTYNSLAAVTDWTHPVLPTVTGSPTGDF